MLLQSKHPEDPLSSRFGQGVSGHSIFCCNFPGGNGLYLYFFIFPLSHVFNIRVRARKNLRIENLRIAPVGNTAVLTNWSTGA